MKTIILLILLFLSTVTLHSQIQTINNGESGLSVRNKLNSNFSYLNTNLFHPYKGLNTLNLNVDTLTLRGYLKINNDTVLKISNLPNSWIFGNGGKLLTGVATDNLFIGKNVGKKATTSNYNVFIGHYAGEENTTAYRNTFIGSYAGNKNTNGLSNTLIGFAASSNRYRGNRNTTIGSGTAQSERHGVENVYIGYNVANQSDSSYLNVIIGSSAGETTKYLQNCTFIGWAAGYGNLGSASIKRKQLGSIKIGYESGRNDTIYNRLFIENSSSQTPLIGGKFDEDKLGVNMPITSTWDSIFNVGGGIKVRGGLFTGAVTTQGNLTPEGRLMIPMGEISYFSTTGTLISISSTSNGSSNMVKANPATTFTNDMNFDNGGANDGRLRYTGTKTRTFHVACTISMDSDGTGTNVYVFGIAKNGTVLPTSKILQSINTIGEIHSTAMHVMVSLATNDYIELYVGNTTDTDDITITSVNLFAMGM